MEGIFFFYFFLMIEGFVLVIVFEQPSALSRDPKDPKFLLAASPPSQRVSMLQVQSGGEDGRTLLLSVPAIIFHFSRQRHLIYCHSLLRGTWFL